MEHQHVQFQFHALGLAVYVVLRRKQHSSERLTGKSLIVLGRVILVDTPHSPFSHDTWESTYVDQAFNLLTPFSFTGITAI
jgi:hypothetical protein